jgi:hypothetical protein
MDFLQMRVNAEKARFAAAIPAPPYPDRLAPWSSMTSVDARSWHNLSHSAEDCEELPECGEKVIPFPRQEVYAGFDRNT